jgi:mono/diheme cytochrome c family protein
MPIFFIRKTAIATPIAGVLALMTLCFPAFATEPQTKDPVFTKEQQTQLIKKGKELATKRCAACHSVEVKGDSPDKDAPPFRTFASKWPLEALEETLAEGIVTGHEKMPEAVFTPKEITAFLEFLRTLQ